MLSELRQWRETKDRKPLVLRGARQTGKSALVAEFGREFEQFLLFNLERPEDRRVWAGEKPFPELLRALYFERDASPDVESTLIFLDEIQESPNAVAQLRFFAEDRPDLCVIAAGSLLDAVLDRFDVSMPVGRVEYRYLHPVSFVEYLRAAAPPSVSEAFLSVPVPEYALQRLFDQFHAYVRVGGMPALTAAFLDRCDLSRVGRMAGDLLQAFVDDAGKYARNPTMFHTLRFAIENAPKEAGNRVTFGGFAGSSYRSREMAEALRTLERAMLIHLVYPTTSTEPPIIADQRKPPRLQYLDTGLVNLRLGLVSDLMQIDDLSDAFRGRIVEHIAGQELLASDVRQVEPAPPWVRRKPGSEAEVDALLHHSGRLVPIEVKSGPTGRLRSLHQFVDRTGTGLGVRLYRGPVNLTEERTVGGTPYRLLNVPYFAASRIRAYIDWALDQERCR